MLLEILVRYKILSIYIFMIYNPPKANSLQNRYNLESVATVIQVRNVCISISNTLNIMK